MLTSGRLAVLAVVLALAAPAAYMLSLRVAVVRNHPEAYVVALAVATGLAALAVVRARRRRWPAWLALGLTGVLLLGGAWFNFVAARVPEAPAVLKVGAPAPDFTLPDAAGRPVALADYRGRKAVVLVFYRGYW
jgi:hypothetical protein